MHFCYLLFCLILALAKASSGSYENHVVVSVTPFEERHYQLLVNLEATQQIDIWNEIRRNGSVHVMLNRLNDSHLIPTFESLNMKPKIIISNVQKLLDDDANARLVQARSGVARIDSMFYNYDQLTIWLKNMVATYPNLATLSSIGKSYEGRDIWVVKLTANSGLSKKRAVLDFGIHAREWISPATGAYMINEFLTTYANGGNAKSILDNWELHFIPILNPDGYAHSHTQQTQRLWRKNRKPTSARCFGVDLNRNFGYKWNSGGSSADPCSDTFHGGSAMSENEAKALQNYMTGKPWETYLTFHSYGQWWFTNWGYTTALPQNYDALVRRANIGANAIKAVNGRAYTVGSSAQILYIASGGSEDWTAGTLGITYSYCIELPPTGSYGFVAPVSEIKRTGTETYIGIVAYLKSF